MKLDETPLFVPSEDGSPSDTSIGCPQTLDQKTQPTDTQIPVQQKPQRVYITDFLNNIYALSNMYQKYLFISWYNFCTKIIGTDLGMG